METIIAILYVVMTLFTLGILIEVMSPKGDPGDELIIVYAVIWPITLIIFLGIKFGELIHKFII